MIFLIYFALLLGLINGSFNPPTGKSFHVLSTNQTLRLRQPIRCCNDLKALKTSIRYWTEYISKRNNWEWKDFDCFMRSSGVIWGHSHLGFGRWTNSKSNWPIRCRLKNGTYKGNVLFEGSMFPQAMVRKLSTRSLWLVAQNEPIRRVYIATKKKFNFES